MEITIKQKKVALTPTYTIENNGNIIYTAKAKILKLMAQVDVFGPEGDVTPVATIYRRFAWFKARYDIAVPDAVLPLEFTTIAIFRRHYRCISGNDVYDIYGNKRRKFSIYKNDEQIAWWDKKAISVMAGDQYTITANDNCDKLLLTTFCLAMDNFTRAQKQGGLVKYDIGNMGFNTRDFNENWRPS